MSHHLTEEEINREAFRQWYAEIMNKYSIRDEKYIKLRRIMKKHPNRIAVEIMERYCQYVDPHTNPESVWREITQIINAEHNADYTVEAIMMKYHRIRKTLRRLVEQ